MKYLAIVALAVLTAAFVPSLRDLQDGARPRDPDLGHEIFYAVLEGLYADGVDNKTVDHVLAVSGEGAYLHFVPGCPTCVYVLEAFRHYRARPDFVSFKARSNTWGGGLAKKLRERFASDDQKTRLDALQGLVKKWVDARMDRLRLTDGERRSWEMELQKRSKEGMMLLEQMREEGRMSHWGESACPSCEGAVDGSQCPPPASRR